MRRHFLHALGIGDANGGFQGFILYMLLVMEDSRSPSRWNNRCPVGGIISAVCWV